MSNESPYVIQGGGDGGDDISGGCIAGKWQWLLSVIVVFIIVVIGCVFASTIYSRYWIKVDSIRNRILGSDVAAVPAVSPFRGGRVERLMDRRVSTNALMAVNSLAGHDGDEGHVPYSGKGYVERMRSKKIERAHPQSLMPGMRAQPGVWARNQRDRMTNIDKIQDISDVQHNDSRPGHTPVTPDVVLQRLL